MSFLPGLAFTAFEMAEALIIGIRTRPFRQPQWTCSVNKMGTCVGLFLKLGAVGYCHRAYTD